MSISLTEKEKKEIENLKPNFNKIIEPQDNYHYVASRRVDVAHVMAKKLLIIAATLNIISSACFALAFGITWKKPYPTFYASTPSGKVYGPLQQLTK